LPEKSVLSDKPNKLSQNEEKQFCRGVLTFCNAIALEAPTSKSGKYLIAPFGDFKKDGYIQRIDALAGTNLKRNFGKLLNRIRSTFSNVCPVYYEHPDNEDNREEPTNPDKTPYGKVRGIEVLANGIYAEIEWLDGFPTLPKALQISPRWNADIISEKIVRPARLLSIGLTAHPNIKSTSFVNSTNQQKGNTMLKAILSLFGYDDETIEKIGNQSEGAPTETEVLDKIKSMLKDKDAEESAQKELEETKTQLANSQSAFTAERTARAELIIANAVKDGKVTSAQRETALKLLINSDDFEKEAKSIEASEPVIKTASETDGIEADDKARQKSREQKRKGIEEFVAKRSKDLGGTSQAYDQAWKEAKAKPEFESAFNS